MTAIEGTSLQGNFTLCEDLPGEILSSRLQGTHNSSSTAERGASETSHSLNRAEEISPDFQQYHLEKGTSEKPEQNNSVNNKGETGSLLEPLLARLKDNSGTHEKQKQQHTQAKLKGSIRLRGLTDPIYNTVGNISTETGNGNTSPLTDIAGSMSDNSDMFVYKSVTGMQEASRLGAQVSGKHQGMGDERNSTKLAKHTLDRSNREEINEQTITNLQRALSNTNPRSPMVRPDAWPFDDPTVDSSDAQDTISSNYNRQATIWGTANKPNLTQLPAMPLPSPAEIKFTNPISRTSSMDHGDYFGPNRGGWGSNRRSSSLQPGPAGPPVTVEPRMYSRRPSFNSSFARTSFDYSVQGHQTSPSTSYTPSPIGTPLSPTATEFTAPSATSAAVWNSHGHDASTAQQTYVSTIEPLNYRRLLERSVNCNWKYIVDKIVCNNDQQASIFLQQKLKIGTPEQKHAIVDAIVSQAYPLMVNRFGNFLVQRCFEHGTPEQIDGIANAIRGNTLALSMDAFGCHVVQKALDCVNEEFKATMVSELLRRIPETVIHRYACHVWQKLFELRWVDAPPQIMKYVNEALRGRWSEVALGETGSLVVQNIFENCLEEDKRPCISEVLASIDLIAHGQFGNWCIQHICEHGAPADRSRAIDVVIHNAPEYSMDQYASKVVEKCLKIGGAEFLDRYLDRVCEGRPDRPRIPLIDIASDQYGNYLVQWILQHASATHREQVASHIRKHMVSLRGSKFGSRVGMLCCNPIYTRAGTGSPHTGAPTTAARFNRYGFR